MKKQLLAAGIIAASLFSLSAKSNDPVLMNVAGKDVRLSEFEYLYNKNKVQQAQSEQSDDTQKVKVPTLEEYVDMFVNYKLKVADAEAAGVDTTAAFLNDFIKYRNELAAPYLVDNNVLDSLVAQSYSHMANEVEVSHIMMPNGDEAKLDSIRTAIVSGNITFEDAAHENSIDRGTSSRGGYMGWVLSGWYPWNFEEAAYATAVGEISPVINSGLGVHIIRVEKRVPARGEVEAAHILRVTRGMPEEIAAQEAVRIDSIYKVVTTPGVDFGEVAGRLSQDPGSAAKGGYLGWFGSHRMVQEFDSVAFAMPNGSYSEPFQTSYGWHIIYKHNSRNIGSLEENREKIINTFARDERGNAPRKAYEKQAIKKYNAKLDVKNIDKIAVLAEELGGTLDSAMLAEFAKSKLPVFSIQGKKTTLGELVPTLPTAALKGGENIKNHIIESSYKLMCEKVMDIAREDLADENADYRNLVNEYRDGILLFEIQNAKVWGAAASDGEALDAYFSANKDKYKWDAPKFKSFIVFASNDSTLNEALNYAATLPSTLAPVEFTQEMRTKFGKDVKIERVIASKGENAITDYLAFGGEKPASENARWSCYAAFKGKILNAPEEAVDVRGQVISDFQAELEQQWLDELHKKFEVKVNDKVLEQVK